MQNWNQFIGSIALLFMYTDEKGHIIVPDHRYITIKKTLKTSGGDGLKITRFHNVSVSTP